MVTRELHLVINGQILGKVECDKRGRLRLEYTQAWQDSRDAIPLSVSMPLAGAEHDHEVVDPFLHGLLPDNRDVLKSWGQRFHVSPRNAFALLSHIGEDCAGAVQFVREDRLDSVLSEDRWEVQWLTTDEIEARLRDLRRDGTAWRPANDRGQFSLAGAQAKTALLFQDGQWGVPSGRAPTTHILKPPIAEFEGHNENEHFSLNLANAMGLPAATSQIMRFGDEAIIVIERYDRATLEQGQGILRLHQEDLCQALGRMPTSKYQNEGGPTPAEVAGLLRDYSSRPMDDIYRFIDALAFNWLTGGTDAHAKNYSILLGPQGQVRLAPLYDLASVLPYEKLDPRRIKLAMKVGSKYRLHDIQTRHWQQLAEQCLVSTERVLARVRELTGILPEKAKVIASEAKDDGLSESVIDVLLQCMLDRAESCMKVLGKG